MQQVTACRGPIWMTPLSLKGALCWHQVTSYKEGLSQECPGSLVFAPQALAGVNPSPPPPAAFPSVALSDVLHTQLPLTLSLHSRMRDQLMCLPQPPAPACCHGNGRHSCSPEYCFLVTFLPPSSPSPPLPTSFSHTKRKHKCFIFILQKAV